MNNNDNEPTDEQIENEEIERQIEYMDEAARGEHGEEAQREELQRRRDAQQREWEEKRYIEEHDRLVAALKSPALVKACMDSFDYALKLKSGEVIRFAQAKWHGNGWLTLDGVDDLTDAGTFFRPPNRCDLPFPADRGVDVRLADILWVMDAPCGS